MWFIFPQITGLGFSETSRFYSISSLPEAEDYLAHPVLGKHLIEISEALLHIEGKTATEILGAPDDIKLCSSMTLFSKAKNTNPVFQAVLAKYFMNATDESTEKALEALASNT